MVEFAEYDGRVSNYITWEEEVEAYLQELLVKMKMTYNFMKNAGVKDIDEYNKKKGK